MKEKKIAHWSVMGIIWLGKGVEFIRIKGVPINRGYVKFKKRFETYSNERLV